MTATHAEGTIPTLNLAAFAQLVVQDTDDLAVRGAHLEAWCALTGESNPVAAEQLARQIADVRDTSPPAGLFYTGDKDGDTLLTVWPDGVLEVAQREHGRWAIPRTLIPAP